MKIKIIENGEVTGAAEGGPDTNYEYWYNGENYEVQDSLATARDFTAPTHSVVGGDEQNPIFGSSMGEVPEREKVLHVENAVSSIGSVDEVVRVDG